MPRPTRISRAQTLALPRPAPVVSQWLVVAVALALLLAGLLGL